MAQYIAKSCGSKDKHDQHIHVMDGQAWACFGYTPIPVDLIDEVIDEALEEAWEPVTIEERRAMGDDMLYPTYDLFGNWEN